MPLTPSALASCPDKEPTRPRAGGSSLTADGCNCQVASNRWDVKQAFDDLFFSQEDDEGAAAGNPFHWQQQVHKRKKKERHRQQSGVDAAMDGQVALLKRKLKAASNHVGRNGVPVAFWARQFGQSM